MAIEHAKQHLKHWNLDSQVLEFDSSSATVLEAAQALNTEPKRIAKTLAFRYNDQTLLVVAAGDARVDNAKFKNTFNLKARMLSPEETLESVGHAVGGVCPFGVKEGCVVTLDVSMKRFESVYPACGSSNSAIHMDLETLEKTSQSTQWVDVCKDWD